MTQRKKTNGKLIALAILLAPTLWIHDRIGPTGLAILVAIVVGVLFLASLKSKATKPGRSSKKTSAPKRTRNSKETTIAIPADKIDDVFAALDRMDTTDYLGLAAEAGQKAKTAVNAGDFDNAWRHYHKQKALYLQHANRSEFTPAQTIALEGSVSRSLANLLRLEGRHGEALVHCVYYYASSPRRTKADEKQLEAYVNRAKIKQPIDRIREFAETLSPIPDFRAVQIECQRWAQTE